MLMDAGQATETSHGESKLKKSEQRISHQLLGDGYLYVTIDWW